MPGVTHSNLLHKSYKSIFVTILTLFLFSLENKTLRMCLFVLCLYKLVQLHVTMTVSPLCPLDIFQFFEDCLKAHINTQTREWIRITLDNQMGTNTLIFELLISKTHKHTQLKRVDMGRRGSATPKDVDCRWFPREHVLTHHTTPMGEKKKKKKRVLSSTSNLGG